MDHPNADDLRAKVFRDRQRQADWRVEKMNEDGAYECVEIFAGPNARQRAIDYARHRFGEYDEIELEPYRYPGGDCGSMRIAGQARLLLKSKTQLLGG